MPAPGGAAAAAAAAQLLVAALALLLCSSGVHGAKKKTAPYDLLVLRQDWGPSSCLQPGVNCTRTPFGAFSIFELVPTRIESDDPYQQGPCTGPEFNVSQIAPEVADELSCVFYNAEGNDTKMWQKLWDVHGKCSKLSIKEFLEALINAFHFYNANNPVNLAGISLEVEPWVNRDILLNSLEVIWGKKAWLSCNPQTRDLIYVSTCFLPVAPADPWNLTIVDCPWKRDSGDPGGRECAGLLSMDPGIAPTPKCSRYYPSTIPGAFPKPGLAPLAGSPEPVPTSPLVTGFSPPPSVMAPLPPPTAPTSDSSTSSSDNTAVVVGATVGAVTAVVAFAAILLVWRKRVRGTHLQHSSGGGGGGKGGGVAIPIVSPKAGGSPDSTTLLFDPASLTLPAAQVQHNVAGKAGWLANSRATSEGQQVSTSVGSNSAQAGTRASSLRSPFNSASLPTSTGSMEADPLLTQITTILSTLHTQQGPCRGHHAWQAGGAIASSPLSVEVGHWAVRWEQIKVQQLIGRGSFGKVYLGLWNATPVAVKVLIRADGIESLQSLELPKAVMQELQEEAGVMARMRHPNLVSFMGLCMLPPCILTEFCSRGSLFDVLRNANQQLESAAELTWRRRLGMAFDAARGLLYLHCRDIIHRDVKSPNLLVDEHWHVKVCDFNLSEILKGQDGAAGVGSVHDSAANPLWLAPEVLMGQPTTTAGDVYAFGLVMWELLAWKLPWGTRSPYQVRRFVLDGGRPEVPAADALPGPGVPPPDVLDAYCSLMRECWSQEPGERPAFHNVVARLGTLLEAL